MPARSVAKKSASSTVHQLSPAVSMKSPAGVEYRLTTVTPVDAENWLARNTNNRNKRKGVVGRYARDMRQGRWNENGSAIVFSDAGMLLDGQHRLEACMISGASFRTLVVTGVPDATQHTIDDGAKRTLADRVTFEGYGNGALLASIARRVALWQAGHRNPRAGSYVPSTQECLALIDADELITLAAQAADTIGRSKLLAPSTIGHAWWLFANISTDNCESFWDGLHRGIGLQEGSPILVLREQLIRHNAQLGSVPEHLKLAWVIKAWNDFRIGATRVRPYTLRTGENFPEPK